MNISTILRMLSELRQLRKHDGWNHEQIEHYQTQMLANLREYTYQNSRFYQHFHRGLYNAPLHELPILTKQMMMEQFDDFVTDPAIRLQDIRRQREEKIEARYLGRYWVNATSGSTGSPGIFLFNHREWATVLASFTRAYEWAGVHVDLTRHRKIAVVSSVTPFHMSFLVGASLHSPWVSSLRLSATEPIEDIVTQLNDWQPETLIAYASMTRILAVEQLAGRLNITPRTVFTSSEVLTDDARRIIEGAWGKHLFNQYASTETGGIAAECEQHKGMHLYEDLILLENVDERNQPVPFDVYGDKLLITVLFNRTQPLIRYELSDSIRMSGRQCDCGRMFGLVDGLQGRQEDVLRFPAADGSEITIHPNLFHQVMDTVSVSGWKIIQRRDGLHVLLSGAQSDVSDDELRKSLYAALEVPGVTDPDVKIEYVDVLPRTLSGKAPLIRFEEDID